MNNDFNCDVAIIGAGIVGLATAYQLQTQRPNLKIIIIEKESSEGLHQTGHNSGVLHSGLYYKPDSKKALNCRKGKALMQEFCEKEYIPFELCGKIIVSRTLEENNRLDAIYSRALSNKIKCKMINDSELLEIEPYCIGLKAIHVPECGIIDYKAVCKSLVNRILNDGKCEILFDHKVMDIKNQNLILIETNNSEIRAKFLVNCAGLYSDKVGSMTLGEKMPVKIIPFKGEYYELLPEFRHLCNNLIYPVPDPKYPFLGVHFTRMIGGQIECGPNAVLALGREAYSNWQIKPTELFEALFYEGFIKLAFEHWPTGLKEMWRSFSKNAFVKELQRLIPSIQADFLRPAPSGIRAQALRKNGILEDDFLIMSEGNVVNVLNAPSPAATSSLQIGAEICEHVISNSK